jgi:uroporphyrinogen-III synthase
MLPGNLEGPLQGSDSLHGKRVAILESRLGDQLAQLIARAGGIPIQAPALAEVPDGDPDALHAFLYSCVQRPPQLFIFQTGVGTQALLDMTKELGCTQQLLNLLAQAKVAGRGPKPAGVLRAHRIRIDLATKDPHTTVELLRALDDVTVAGSRVVVQRYGESNRELEAALRRRGAEVVELPTYRWALPQDTAPLARLLDALDRDEVDAVVFTSASQGRNLFSFARAGSHEDALRAGLKQVKVFSIGPVCTRALAALDVHVDGEAAPPKLGPLMALLRGYLS